MKNTSPISVEAGQSERTMVVIDMQPQGFPNSRSVLRAVKQELLRAMRSNAPIVIVEYDLECAGRTDEELMNLLADSGYQRFRVAAKKSNDGSSEVIDTCSRNGFPADAFRVMGVMTDECVKATVTGLLGKMPHASIEVVTDACRTWSGDRYDWSIFASHPNLKLVTTGS